eukprot:2666505-Pyramimonas_sp.AAC.1
MFHFSKNAAHLANLGLRLEQLLSRLILAPRCKRFRRPLAALPPLVVGQPRLRKRAQLRGVRQ